MLTDSKIKRLKPPLNAKKPDKYSDGNGLQLHVFPNEKEVTEIRADVLQLL